MTTGDSDHGFRIETPDAVEERLRSEPAEDDLAAGLPFPVAFAWDRVSKETEPWDRLFRDGLETVLRYLGVVAASEYLAEEDHTDPGVNDALKPLGRGGPSAGHWLQLVRRCARREPPGRRALPGLEEGWQQVEEEHRVRLVWPRRNLDTQPQGLLSTLVTARNHLFGHGVAPEPGEREAAARRLRQLYRLALESLAPVWRHRLHLPVPADGGERFLRLRGLQDFAAVEPPAGAGTGGWVAGRGGVPVPLYPLALADRPGAGEGTLLGRSAELYLINYLRRSEVPVYMGLRGDVGERPDLADDVSALFERKGVWDRRRDLELDQVLAYAAEDKAERSLEYFRRDGLYTPAAHVDRTDLQAELDAFLESGDARLLFVTGRAGTGKTASLARWTERLRDRDVPVLLLRGIELPEREVTSAPRLEEWLCGELGWDGELAEVLDRAAEREPGRLVIVLEGLNEFADLGRDLDGLWRAVNELVERHAEHEALKVVVSARSEGPRPEAYLPGGEPPATFADPSLYWRSDGEHFLRVEGLSPEESVQALVRRGVADDRARRAVREHGEALSNPMNVVRFADGLLAGEELDEVTTGELALSYIERRVAESPDLAATLRNFIAVLGEEESLALGLDDLREANPELADRLEPGGGLLERMLSLELVRLHHVEGSDGRPVPTLSPGDDRIFESLSWRTHARLRIRSELRDSLRMAAIMAVALLGGWFYLRSRVQEAVPAFAPSARSDLQAALVDAGVPAGRAADWSGSAAAVYSEIVGRIEHMVLHDLIVGLALIALTVLLINTVTTLLTIGATTLAESRYRENPRIAYYGQRIAEAIEGKIIRPALFPVYAALLYIFFRGLVDGYEAFLAALETLAPALGGWAVLLVAAMTVYGLRRARGTGSTVALRSLLAPASLRQSMINASAAVAGATIGIALLLAFVGLPPESLPGYDLIVGSDLKELESSFESASELRTTIHSEAGAEAAAEVRSQIPMDLTGLAESRDAVEERARSPILPEGSPLRGAVFAFIYWGGGGCLLALVLHFSVVTWASRRTYPDEW